MSEEENEVPQIDNKEELAAYGIKNYKKICVVIGFITLMVLLVLAAVGAFDLSMEVFGIRVDGK